jgi:hypothetical protein
MYQCIQKITMNDRLTQFTQQILKGQPIPADLQQLLQLAWGTAESSNPLAAWGLQILEPGHRPLPDNSYLNETDRANPDIMANVKAIDDLFKMAIFVAEHEDGDLYGYWQGAENTPLTSAPIIQYDTEGQFNILGGSGLIEAIAANFSFSEESTFQEFRTAFADQQILFSATSLDTLVWPEITPRPNDLKNMLYAQYLSATSP